MGFPPSRNVAFAQKRTQIVAHSFVDVVAKLAIVRPSFDDKRLIAAYDNTAEAGILMHIQSTLYLDAVVSAYATVGDKRTDSESLAGLRALADDSDLMAGIKQMHLTYTSPISMDEAGEPTVSASFRARIVQEELAEAEVNYQQLCERAPKLWDEFSKSDIFSRIKKSRDKVLAHHGKNEDDAGPRLNQLEEFGLTWFDCQNYLVAAEPILNDFTLLFCQTDFNFESTRTVYDASARRFWKTCRGPDRRNH